ncbi:uncharacterized protein PV06_08806 [Exophiala oligosperma]|uniref:Zn(2)-C6 fungal-type domain-containing protein n=2 Tax=Chaetothyriales TaxID=34395 RepID=A0A0D2D769_9EURO|nr:uncharacterized protein PV06_08806 [Exophiala oligosperma]KAJ9644903.1 hypothetical protein H2204_001365 [Knufia peltigerae]KIW38988.1 hypothetical protein PV06_08806 [Exophiala oligosperma]
MFKSCQYCQHRKKKCVLPQPSASDSRCFACQHLDIRCEIGFRKPSFKRRLKSHEVSSRVYTQYSARSSATLLRPTGSLREAAVVHVNNGDCQLPRVRADSGSLDAAKMIMTTDETESGNLDQMTTAEKYQTIVSCEFPFLPREALLSMEEAKIPEALSYCVDLAAQLSLQNRCAGLSESQVQKLSILVNQQDLDLIQAAGLMLLLPRVNLTSSIIEKAFTPFAAIENIHNIPLPVSVGALTAQAWICLVGHTLQSSPPNLPPSMLLDYAASLDHDTFAPHYLRLTYLAASFLELRNTTTIPQDGEPVAREVAQEWARLEYSCLLNVAQMPSEFLDVRDDMPATPAAVITHMLQSLIYLRLYGYALIENPAVGREIGLRPVPGVLYFICAISRSIFVCQQQIVEHWSQLAQLQATAAETLLRFWELTNFENCRALLNLWDPLPGQFEFLKQTIRERIGPGPWTIELIDGYSVFWTFRDLRSLSLEVHMRS